MDTNRCMNTYLKDTSCTSFYLRTPFVQLSATTTSDQLDHFALYKRSECRLPMRRDQQAACSNYDATAPRWVLSHVQLITLINFRILVTLVFPGISFRSSHNFKDDSLKWPSSGKAWCLSMTRRPDTVCRISRSHSGGYGELCSPLKTNISEKHVASIFRVDEWAKQETSMKQAVSLAYSLTLTMEATCSSKTLVDFQQTTRCDVPEDNSPHKLLLYNVVKPLSRVNLRCDG
jgi:hypothetical protein